MNFQTADRSPCASMYSVVSTVSSGVCSVSSVDVFTCRTPAIADIVILVDGSWSIGRINFRLVRMFLESLVRAFAVGSEHTRVGASAVSCVFVLCVCV